MDKIIVTVSAILGVAFVYWFFLGKREKAVAVEGAVDILVEGGYSPSVISVPVGKSTKINFIRRDASSCLEEVIIPDFKIRQHLPLNTPVSVEITPPKVGEYLFACGMNMYHGKIIAR